MSLPVYLLRILSENESKITGIVFGVLTGTLKMSSLNRYRVTFRGKIEMWL